MLSDLPLALAVRAAGAAIARAGPRGAYLFARLIGKGWYRLLPVRRAVTRRNLEIAFRDRYSREERERIAEASYCHTMATAMDVFLRERAVRPGTWTRFITADPGVEEVFAREHPRGIALLSAHLGDWEMLQYYFALRGLPAATVARRIHNPHLDRLALELRTRRGGSVIPKTGALRKVWRALRSAGAVGLMTDQSAPPGEGFQKFFGASASTNFQYARLLARARPEVVFVVCVREGFGFRFRILSRDLSGAIAGPESEDRRAQKLVEDYLATLEGWIRDRPEQYLWMHRRWKWRPSGAPDLYRRLGRGLDPGIEIS